MRNRHNSSPQPELEVSLSDNFILQILPPLFNLFRSQVSTALLQYVGFCDYLSDYFSSVARRSSIRSIFDHSFSLNSSLVKKGKSDYLGLLISVSQTLNVDFEKYKSIELQLRYKNPDKYGFFTTQKFSVDTIKNLVDNDCYRIFIINVHIII